ncbi:MAG: hypothetical protein RML75_17355 [Cyanobacteriota bacterium SKYGB_h_bin112]|nr:hypothetical protein [Cyanobacteriota bacterium SKYGB_h_bin112]
MASSQDVRQYLAYWFQLGKRVLSSGGSQALLPRVVIAGDRYSDVFETCWREILVNPSAYYLEGTTQTIADLLSPKWELLPCARCSMPVPMPSIGLADSSSCPCSDLPMWPNLELPSPRSPVNSQKTLENIHDRLIERHQPGETVSAAKRRGTS